MRMAEKSLDANIEVDRRDSLATARAVSVGLWITGGATVLSLTVALSLALAGVPYWWTVLVLPIFTTIPRIIRAAKGVEEDDPPAAETGQQGSAGPE